MAQKAKKKWYTIAWVTREGQPHPAHRNENFSQVFKTEDMLIEDLSYGMIHFSRGAYVAAVWPGQIGEWIALHSNLKPLLYVYENGSVQRLP